MKYTFLLLFSCLFLSAEAQIKPHVRVKAVPPSNAAKFWIFLLAGQSNMAGRGNVEPVDTLPNSHVLVLNSEATWEIAKDPIHFDRSIVGVGPGFSFGKMMVPSDTSVYIGLVPCAVGGSEIGSWEPGSERSEGGKNYLQAIERCKKAMGNGTLKGIIWYQGESDCTEKGVVNYGKKLSSMVSGFRRDLNAPDLIFIAGELPEFQKQQPDKQKQLQDNPYVSQINLAIDSLKGIIPAYDYITTEGTAHRGDHLHFDSISARLLGKRFAALMTQMLNATAKH